MFCHLSKKFPKISDKLDKREILRCLELDSLDDLRRLLKEAEEEDRVEEEILDCLGLSSIVELENILVQSDDTTWNVEEEERKEDKDEKKEEMDHISSQELDLDELLALTTSNGSQMEVS